MKRGSPFRARLPVMMRNLAVEAARRRGGPVLFVAEGENEADAALAAMAFFAPADSTPFLSGLGFCLPYDRVSPKPDIEHKAGDFGSAGQGVKPV